MQSDAKVQHPLYHPASSGVNSIIILKEFICKGLAAACQFLTEREKE
jgi:hypothetical protein